MPNYHNLLVIGKKQTNKKNSIFSHSFADIAINNSYLLWV